MDKASIKEKVHNYLIRTTVRVANSILSKLMNSLDADIAFSSRRLDVYVIAAKISYEKGEGRNDFNGTPVPAVSRDQEE